MAAPKKYGLIIQKGKTVAANKPLPVKKSVFGDDSDDEEELSGVKLKAAINRSLVQESQKKASNMQAKLTMAKALEDDPTVYQYDEVYDAMEQSKKSAVASKKKAVDRKPKYIHSLLKNAAARKLEDERREERKAHGDRQKEGDEFEDKDAFITPSYKRKMEELRAAEEEARRREAAEAANDVTKQKDMSNFYRNLLSRNISKGGRFAGAAPEDDQSATKSESTKSEPTDDTRSIQEKDTPLAEGESHDDDRHDQPSSSEDGEGSESLSDEEELPLPAPPAEEEVSRKRPPPAPTESVAPEAKLTRRNDETAVLSARERYLQRKKLQQAAKGQ